MMPHTTPGATTLARPVAPERWAERLGRWNARHAGDEVLLELRLLHHRPGPPERIRLDRIVYDPLARAVELRVGPARGLRSIVHSRIRVPALNDLVMIDDSTGRERAVRLSGRHIRVDIMLPWTEATSATNP